MECFHKPGTWDQPAKAQDVLPTMTEYEFDSYDNLDGTICTEFLCEKWVYRDTKYPHKISTYTMWVKREGSLIVPVKYEIVGYNVLLESHYDHWIMDYGVSNSTFHL